MQKFADEKEILRVYVSVVVEIIGLQKKLGLVSLRLKTQPGTTLKCSRMLHPTWRKGSQTEDWSAADRQVPA
jgi:hypothetical protein